MQQVFTAAYYTGKNYPLYFQTEHWLSLNDDYIYSNSDAKCWICQKTYTLLLHHEKYENLFNERLFRDVFILCFDCHTQLHFYRFLFFFRRKTKLNPKSLRKRRLYLKTLYCIRSRKFFPSLWYFLRYLFGS